jgi:hypothetical protein
MNSRRAGASESSYADAMLGTQAMMAVFRTSIFR